MSVPQSIDSEDGRATVPRPQAAASGEPEPIQPGDEIGGGQFRIEGMLGQGGMASVFRATDLRSGKAVALKVIAPRYAHRPDRERRFENEARLAARLAGHRNIAAPISCGRLPEPDLGGRMFLAMELARGPTLLDLVSMHGTLPVDDAIEHVRDVARALRDLHDSGVVHRDVKPSNVIVVETAEGTVAKLVDFGLAADVNESAEQSSRLTRVGERPGTHHYMSPEQAFGAAAHPTFDVYALGATLYELLIGEPPFHELSPSQVIQRKCELNLPGPSIAGKRRDFPPGLAELVDDCLCPRPGDRVRSMAAFLQRLDGLRDGAGITRNRASENTAMVGVARTVDGAAKKHRLGEIVAEAARAKAAGEPPPPELTPIRTGATRPEIAADRIALHARGATVPAPSAGARGRTELAPAATTHARTELAPAAVADEPPRRRAAVLAVVGAVAIVGGGLAAWWIVSQRPSEPELAPIATHAGSAEATPQPEPPPEPAPTADPETADPTTSIAPLAIAVGSTGDAPEPAEVDTGAVEPDPAPAVAPRPPSNDSGSATPQPRDKPRPPADPWTPERCREERQAAQEALTSGRYAGALSHSRIRKCWPDATERQKIRVQAFFELSRYADCIDAGSSSSDPTIQRTVRRCTKARDAAD